jgi:hypothetical protein
MKEANKIPLEILLEELLSYALNIEEASVNPGHDAEGNSNHSNQKTETTIPKKREVEKANITRKVEETSPHLFLMVNKYLVVFLFQNWPH